MSHSHGHGDPPSVPVAVQRRLFVAVVPLILATIAALVILWPSGTDVGLDAPGATGENYSGEVVATAANACAVPPQAEAFVCSVVTIEVTEGPDEGTRFDFNHSTAAKSRTLLVGDKVIVSKAADEAVGVAYYFLDYDRQIPLLVLGILFAVVVIALSRWHGLFALLGVGLSLGILVIFVMPAILEGANPIAVAITGSAAIMFATLYLAHGVNARTTTAILGTLMSLGLTGILAVAFVEIGRFTGFGSEEATFLQLSASQVNLEGLLLGGIIIGTLGVLDDVTITQTSAVWELRVANPGYRFRDLYRAGIRIGRDHIASTVITLVLAYAGGSLHLLIVFTVSGRELPHILNSEVVAEEIVRTLVGSIGLVASVPLTTALAVAVAVSGRRGQESSDREFWGE